MKKVNFTKAVEWMRECEGNSAKRLGKNGDIIYLDKGRFYTGIPEEGIIYSASGVGTPHVYRTTYIISDGDITGEWGILSNITLTKNQVEIVEEFARTIKNNLDIIESVEDVQGILNIFLNDREGEK